VLDRTRCLTTKSDPKELELLTQRQTKKCSAFEWWHYRSNQSPEFSVDLPCGISICCQVWFRSFEHCTFILFGVILFL